MTVTLDPRVLELIASRICHDLVSPVGAISNGVELVQEMGEEAGAEAMTLIATSAQQAGIRLKCFRLAYGAAGTDKNIGFRDIKEVFSSWLSAGHVQAEFGPGIDVKFSMPPRGFYKCLLNVLIFAEECCRGDGKIRVTLLEDGSSGLKITTTGKQIGFRDGAEAAFKGETAPDDLDPRSVHGYITQAFARHFGLTLAHQLQPDFGRLEITLTF